MPVAARYQRGENTKARQVPGLLSCLGLYRGNTRYSKRTTTNERCAFIRRQRFTVAATGTGSKPDGGYVNTMATAGDGGMTGRHAWYDPP